jgi:tRNA/rRNA methyltransferase
VKGIVVLVEPARGGNIGAAARAMKTMGFEELRVVGDTPYLSNEALAFAHGSQEILRQARSFDTLSSAVDDVDVVVGTTARRRGDRSDYYTPGELTGMLADGARGASVALVFGREESGLTNDELNHCQIVSAVPMRRPYPSLNLAQAVMVYTYELSPLFIGTTRPLRRQPDPDTVRVLISKLERLLPAIGFDPNRAKYRRLLERAGAATHVDVKLMHSVVNALEVRLEDELRDGTPE